MWKVLIVSAWQHWPRHIGVWAPGGLQPRKKKGDIIGMGTDHKKIKVLSGTLYTQTWLFGATIPDTGITRGRNSLPVLVPALVRVKHAATPDDSAQRLCGCWMWWCWGGFGLFSACGRGFSWKAFTASLGKSLWPLATTPLTSNGPASFVGDWVTTSVLAPSSWSAFSWLLFCWRMRMAWVRLGHDSHPSCFHSWRVTRFQLFLRWRRHRANRWWRSCNQHVCYQSVSHVG